MAKGAEKNELRLRLLTEIEKFHFPNQQQTLKSIQNKLWPNDKNAKQKLNYHLQTMVREGLIRQEQRAPYAIYKLNVDGLQVKEMLITTEKRNEIVTWGYENLLVGYEVLSWGSWEFLPKGHKKRVPMNNWTYQIVNVPVNTNQGPVDVVAKLQDTGKLLISGPSKIMGPDPEELRQISHTMVRQAAQWFADNYDMKLGPPEICREGERYLPDSTALCKILGKFKKGDLFINSSPPHNTPHLEEKDSNRDNPLSLKNILSTFEETPGRLSNLEKGLDRLGPAINDLARNIELHLGVESQQLETMKGINQGIAELRAAVKDMSTATRVSEPSGHGDRGNLAPFHERKQRKDSLEDYTGPSEPKNVEILITRETGPFSHLHKGAGRIVGPFYPGARIWLPEDTARQLCSDGYAERIQEDKAGAE